MGELAAELFGIDAVLGSFSIVNENDGNVVAELLGEVRIGVDIHFTESSAEFREERLDDAFGVFAQVAAGAGVEGDVARPARSQPQIFRALAHGLGVEYFMNGPECG